MRHKDKKKELAKIAEQLWKQVSLLKWGNKCLICGKSANTFHHFIPRSRSLVLRYDVNNAIPICNKCHYKIHFSKDPTEVAEMVELIKKKRGKRWERYIEEKKKKIGHGLKTIKWYQQQITKLKRQLKYYEKQAQKRHTI